MALYIPLPEPAPFDYYDWLEAMDMTKPSGEDVFTNESADVSLSVIIPGVNRLLTQSKLRSAVYGVLGYAYADDAAPWALHRIPPLAHPIWGYQLRASQVSFAPFNPLANTLNTNNSPYAYSDITNDWDDQNRFGTYSKAVMNVRFSMRPYYLYADDNPEWDGYEYNRYVTQYEIAPEVEYITATTDRSIQFIDPCTGMAATNNPYGKAFPGEVGIRVSKPNLQMIWHEVPDSFVCTATGVPEKIFNCIGTVNKYAFKGFPAQTLLFEPPVFQKCMYPWYSVSGRAYYWNITFNFKYFNPKVGASATLGDKGWRLLPWRFGGDNSSDGVEGGVGWYSARRVGVSTGTQSTIIPETDFATAFTHVGAPAMGSPLGILASITNP